MRLDFDRRTKEISIHSPHARRDRKVEIRARRAAKFQSTPLIRGETKSQVKIGSPATFQSAPLMRGETPKPKPVLATPLISIHSPHTRGDSGRQTAGATRAISIRSPHARGDEMTVFSMFTVSYFDPLPSCEGRLDQGAKDLRQQIISIRSPLTRGDLVGQDHQADFVISIHSPHTRGDRYGVRTMRLVKPISIHSPHTRGDRAFRLDHSGIPFQSTPLARGETLLFNLFKRLLDISIHSPHTRGDGWSTFWAVDGAHFNPLPSHEGRLVKRFLQFFYNNFNPLPSHEGRPTRY